MKHHKRCRNKFGMSFANFGMTAGKFGVAFAALAFLTVGFCACSNDSDNNSSGSDPTPTVKTYTEASEAEKALFTVTYDAEQLAALSHMEQTLTDAITITASVPWTIEEYSDGCYDTWALLSTEESNATTQTTTKITLDIEDNLAEFWAGVTYDENGNPDMSAAQMPDDRTTILHILNAAGKQVAAITLRQTGTNLTGGLVTGSVISSNHQYVGRGYDIFTGAWANPYDVKKSSIISMEKMESRGKSIEFQAHTDSEYTTYTGKTLKELTDSFNISADVSTNIYKFSGEVKASYGLNYKETGSEEYAIYYYKARLGAYWLDRSEMIDRAVIKNADGSFTNQYLSDGAFAAIYGKDSYAGEAGIKKLISTYGTHVIISGIMGGRRDYTMRMTSTGVEKGFDVSACVKAGYKSLWGSVDAEVSADYKEMTKNSAQYTSVKVKGFGGSTNLALSEEEWQDEKYLNMNTAALIDFEEDSLVPIWELCLDEKRATAIRKYIALYGGTQSTDTIVGQIVLKDGSLASPKSYTSDSSNPAVGVIAYVGTGGTLGRKDTVYMLGVKIADNYPYEFSNIDDGDIFEHHYYGLAVNPNRGFYSFGVDAKSITSQYDGTGNWAAILAKLGQSYKIGEWPAFEWAQNYGRAQGLAGTPFETGWFIPSSAEVKEILNNYDLLNASLDVITGASKLHNYVIEGKPISGTPDIKYTYNDYIYWSSTSADDSGLQGVYRYMGNKLVTARNYSLGVRNCVLVAYPIPIADLFDSWSIGD
ncbi:MAG: hypothetical protein IJP62_05310 [Treponema sp.]|nr:hypothetical protein [Bacteroidaceae bacterium]MBQ6780634.1 hypothetical protein [Treponema sp.]